VTSAARHAARAARAVGALSTKAKRRPLVAGLGAMSTELTLTRVVKNCSNPLSFSDTKRRQLGASRAVRVVARAARLRGFPCQGAPREGRRTLESPGTRNRGATEMATKKKKSKSKTAKKSPKAKKAKKRSPKRAIARSGR
jgi:hypothetical protein